jgi:hypothetical protein
MLKALLKQGWMQDFVAFVASFYMRLVFHTSRWQHVNFETPSSYLADKRPFITCFWHARLLMLPYAWPDKKNPFYMLISAHKDGRLISKTVGHFGIRTIAGSTERGGTEALLGMVRHSRQGDTLGITPDGPRGPPHEVSDGTVMLSYLAKADLIPVTFTTSRKKFLKTWDRFLLPLPFSRGVFMWGTPVIYPKEKKNLGLTQKKLEHALKTVCEKAENVLNG